ncbi:hypothetical protein ABZ942_30420 [Nocardia sp. NPDC046473]|uniref:hypothetical protein n=1 Tax=Nocardia sp. NPDC046473 TaxID=3155733 RepID=UPI0033E1B2D3
MSATYRKDGWYPAVFEAIAGLNATAFESIDDHHISDEQMRSIAAKTMVIVGDADAVRPEHAPAMFTLRGGDEQATASGMLRQGPPARLVVPAATSHVGIAGESAVLAPMVTAFLDEVPPATPDLC